MKTFAGNTHHLCRQRGIALVTVLLVMTTVSLLGLTAQRLVESNIRLEGARYQTSVARGSASTVMTVFRALGRPRLALLIPNNRQPVGNIDLTTANLGTVIDDAQLLAAEGSGGLVEVQPYVYSATIPSFVSVDYLGTAPVPPGNDAEELFPSTINSGVFCADFFRLISGAITTANARGAIDQNLYIVSPCLN